MIEYKCYPFHEVGHEISINMKRHYAEMKKKDNDYGEIDADWDAYIKASFMGNCVAFIAKCHENTVAYSVFMLTNNVNHKTIKEATNTAIYIFPAYRSKLTANFIKWTHEYLFNANIKEISYLTNDKRMGRFLRRCKLSPTHELWVIKQ